MKKNAVCFFGVLIFLLPFGFSAENSGMDSPGVSGAQKNPFNAILRPNTELLSKLATVFPENGRFEPGGALPALISVSKPIVYPGWARRKGSEGLLIVALEILENGSVGRWQIIKSTGEESLDKAATKTFLAWKFQPAMKNGKPVKTCIQVPINFELTKE